MSHRLEKKQRDRKKKSILKYALLILTMAMVAGLFYGVGQNLLTAYNQQRQETVLAHYGYMEDKLQGNGLVLRSETVVPASASGFFENIVSDGQKVALHTLLGYYLCRGEKTPMRAATTGLFTRQLDGLEEALQDVKLATVGPELFSYRPQHHDPKGEFKAGQSVFKIVNNLQPTRLILQFPLQELNPKIAQNQIVALSIDGQSLGQCTVIDFKKDFKKLVMMVETADFREELLNRRQVEVMLIMNSQSGYLVPEKSLFDRGQEKGIYCTKGEEILFRPVKVLAIKEGTALVEGLQANDMVILKPEKVKL